MKSLSIEIAGDTLDDLIIALAKVKDKIENGDLNGSDGYETGECGYRFDIIETFS